MGDYIIEVKLEDDFFESTPQPIPPLPDDQFNNLNDPFSDLDSDSVQEMIDKNDLIPSSWKNPREKSNDPFDFPDSLISEKIPDEKIGSSRGDYNHIPPYKEAFPSFQRETKGLNDGEPDSSIPTDIFAEDWYQSDNANKKYEPETTATKDIKP
ncbi:MAG: hypothetical protein HGB14_12230 [Anaerolineaceae bacterium]|nr:hypothetical protein [Anaerolineaceae bacterium]